ncbi:MAG: hypothetical protein JEY99_12790 [Spirochaetales bacterium]|nr:hypothetical protein [Spirochaetales bacterium]
MIRSLTRTTFRISLLGLVLFFMSCGSGTGLEPDSLDTSRSLDSSSVSDSRSINQRVPGELYSDEITAVLFRAEGATLMPHEEFVDLVSRAEDEFKPWVNQLRLVDFIHYNDKIYFGVNGRGIGRINSGDSLPEIEYPRENGYFKERTLGKIVLGGQEIFCQIYGDRVFSNLPPSGEAPLVSYSLTESDYRVLDIPVGRSPTEELVESCFKEDEWFLSWKSSGPEGISFRYHSWNPATGRAESIEVEEYRLNFLPLALSKGPETISAFLEECLPIPSEETVYVITWNYPDGRSNSFYYGDTSILSSGGGDVRFLTGLSTPDGMFLLEPAANTLWNNLFQESQELPPLPEKCVYTGFSILDNWLILSWEEQKFPMVGTSGLLLVKFAG